METSITVGFACRLLRQEMKQIIISSDTRETKSLEKMENKFDVDMAIKKSVVCQLMEGKELLGASIEKPEALALIIDGKSLTYALEDDVVIDSAASLDDTGPSGDTTGNNSMDSSRGYGAPVRPYFGRSPMKPYFDQSPVRPYFDQSSVRPYFDQSPVRPYGRMYDNLDYDNDQVLSSMQQKLDDLCEQLNSSEENRVVAINKLSNKDRELQLEETFGSERIKFVDCGCWHYEEHSSFYNDDGKQGQHKFWGTRMFKYGDVDTRKGVGEAKRLAATRRLQN